MKSKLERMIADEDFKIVQAVIAYLRSCSPRMVPTDEIAAVLGRHRGMVYGLVKKAREYLALTTGEFVPNTRKKKERDQHGYTITFKPRAGAFEAVKSFDRAAGHLSQGIAVQSRIPEGAMSSPEDRDLWLSTRARSRAARFFLEANEDARSVALVGPNNARLAIAAADDTATPWESIGLSDPHMDQD